MYLGEMEGDQENKNLPKGLVKRVVHMMTMPFPSVWRILVEKKSRLAGWFSTLSQGHKAKKQEGNVQIIAETVKLGIEVNVNLPEDLVERILAMVPFPHVLKARALSKSWRARLSPIDSRANKEKQELAISFQKQVSERSMMISAWKSPIPVFIDLTQRLWAYDWESDSWPKATSSLSFLPTSIMYDLYPELLFPNCQQQIDGFLLLVSRVIIEKVARRDSLVVYHPDHRNHMHGELKLHVANLLTQCWKQLPRCPPLAQGTVHGSSLLSVKLVSQPSLDKYKVIVFYKGFDYCIAQCYDSKSKAWRSTVFVERFTHLSAPAHLNGVLYMVVGCRRRLLLAFNVEDETLKDLNSWVESTTILDVVECNGDLLMVVIMRENAFQTLTVLKIDLGLRKLSKVARGPRTLGTWKESKCV